MPIDSEMVAAWQTQQIETALATAKAGGPFIPHHRIAEWALSLGTTSPLPLPTSLNAPGSPPDGGEGPTVWKCTVSSP